ncbi:M23 family metallopeptidase [Nocardia sp. 2]|uniref:M23 family metallopeptidase n=1 Tax=Nocardia acididurans TaxID=2802282 RepID=A0ABS1M4Y6_9NOCA|nr:M23 family metallopeptidase [Nocardia acididurans]MBL1074844.1 M23 family metallopeptidase [Nocardia acididurans]
MAGDLLSVDRLTALRDSRYGGWIWAVATVLVLTYLVEFGWNLVRGRRRKEHPARPAVAVMAPVLGDWTAVNSPADRVPSHGTEWGGQGYAIDLVRNGAEKPGFRLLRLHRPEEFPAFGSPVLSPAEATVVEVVDRRRDHRARYSVAGLLYFFVVEQIARSLAPVSFVFGNTLVLELADGTYARVCHLRRGSVTVRVGDRVDAGQVIARCGNSGNSTEPHVHFQLMDSLDTVAARGIPFTWNGIGVPRTGERFTTPAAA